MNIFYLLYLFNNKQNSIYKFVTKVVLLFVFFAFIYMLNNSVIKAEDVYASSVSECYYVSKYQTYTAGDPPQVNITVGDPIGIRFDYSNPNNPTADVFLGTLPYGNITKIETKSGCPTLIEYSNNGNVAKKSSYDFMQCGESDMCYQMAAYEPCPCKNNGILGGFASEDALNEAVAKLKSGSTSDYGLQYSESPNNVIVNYNEEPDTIQDADIGSATADQCAAVIGPQTYEILKGVYTAIRIIVPILVVALVTMDMANAVLSGDENAMKKAQSNAIKRVVIGLAIFFVPTVLNFLLSMLNIGLGTCELGG